MSKKALAKSWFLSKAKLNAKCEPTECNCVVSGASVSTEAFFALITCLLLKRHLKTNCFSVISYQQQVPCDCRDGPCSSVCYFQAINFCECTRACGDDCDVSFLGLDEDFVTDKQQLPVSHSAAFPYSLARFRVDTAQDSVVETIDELAVQNCRSEL